MFQGVLQEIQNFVSNMRRFILLSMISVNIGIVKMPLLMLFGKIQDIGDWLVMR